jgi:DeoR/GlpR family transcriptional regulator of sugar metabolism
MFADERKGKILEQLSHEGAVHIKELVEAFGVSSETIRRDLNELSRDGKLRKVHGGAIALRHPAREQDYEIRVKQNSESKREIGQYAAGLIEDGDIVALDYGATTEEIARAVCGLKNVTFLTNSLNTAGILVEKLRHNDFTGKIIFIGGVLNAVTAQANGTVALSNLSRFTADKAFLGVTSISTGGLMMWNEEEGEFSACLAGHASDVYVVADSTKFDKESFYKFLDLGQVGHIITDSRVEISEQIKSAIHSAGTELLFVKAGEDKMNG